MQIPTKPMAPTQLDQSRWEHSALRRRMLTGLWLQDLEQELQRHLSADRREAWGAIDLSSNPFEVVTRQLAMLYHETPNITNEFGDISALIGREGEITRAGLWPMMQRAQQMTLGMRECIIRIDIDPHIEFDTPRNTGLQFRLVTPDFVYCESSPNAPDIPLYYQELRLRADPTTKKPQWVADVIDIRDPMNPKFGMFKVAPDGKLKEDVSKVYMGHATMTGENFPFLDGEGRPFLPLVIYRAEKTGQLWNALDMSTLVYGSLTSACLYSLFVHGIRDASWPQRYIAGLALAGLSALDQDTASRRAAISTDPTSVLVFYQDPDSSGQPLVGQFQPGVNPNDLLEAVSKYEYRVSVAGGISPEQIQRTNSDPRSGVALSISRAGQREAQRKYAPVSRIYDEELLAKASSMANRFLGLQLPERGYRVSYVSLPQSPDEIKAIREDVIGKLDAGLISPVQAIQILNPDMDDSEARQELLKIRRERAEFL